MQLPKIISAGEFLVDLISTDYADSFREADRYQRIPGGSPANLAMNLARLGVAVGLAATVGQDDSGALLLDRAIAAGVRTEAIRRTGEPTSLILVTKSRAVSNFEAYRMADRHIQPDQFPAEWIGAGPILHTTAFALSQDPARSTILGLAERIVAAGGKLSIDLNYAGKIWPDRLEALWVITQYLQAGGADAGALVKCSDVDYERLFGEPLEDKAEAIEILRDLGAGVVCLTLGKEGSYTAAEGMTDFSLPARHVDVKDTTGAGDAFWSGFLAAHLVGKDWEDCARAGRAVAERKLTRVGPVTENLELEVLLND